MTTDLWDSFSELPIEDLDVLAQPIDLGSLADLPLQVGYEPEPASGSGSSPAPSSPEAEAPPAQQPQKQPQPRPQPQPQLQQDDGGLFTPRTFAALASMPAVVAPAPVPAAPAMPMPMPMPMPAVARARRALNPQGEEHADLPDDDDEDDYEESRSANGPVKRSRKSAVRNEERMLRKKSREKMRRRRVNELFDDMAKELAIDDSSNRVEMLMQAVARIRGLKAELAAARETVNRAAYVCEQAGLPLPAGPPASVPVSLESLTLGAMPMDVGPVQPQQQQPQAHPAQPQQPFACAAGSCQPIRAPAPAPTRRSARQRRPRAVDEAGGDSADEMM